MSVKHTGVSDCARERGIFQQALNITQQPVLTFSETTFPRGAGGAAEQQRGRPDRPLNSLQGW